MLVILRIVFGGALFYGIVVSRKYAGDHPDSGDVMNAFHLAVCVILGIANAIVWAPYFGAKLSDPLTSAITKSTYVDRRNYLRRLIYWAQDHGWRRFTLFLCFLEGIHHPDQPTAFVIGLKNARPGSWLEKVYAREVFKFDNAQHCVQACAALKRHGIDPRPHHNPEVNLLLMSMERSIHPDPDKVAIPSAPSPPAPPRNRQIRLFESAPTAGPEAAQPSSPSAEETTGISSASGELAAADHVALPPSPQKGDPAKPT